MTMSRRVSVSLLAFVISTSLLAGCAQRVSRSADDNTLRVRVRTALLNDPEIKGSNINVSVVNGVVTLRGPVQSKEHEQMAVKVASGISGVTEVKSELKVR